MFKTNTRSQEPTCTLYSHLYVYYCQNYLKHWPLKGNDKLSNATGVLCLEPFGQSLVAWTSFVLGVDDIQNIEKTCSLSMMVSVNNSEDEYFFIQIGV